MTQQTSKFESYIQLLKAGNSSLQRTSTLINNKMALNNKIVSILERRSHNQRIPLKDYNDLAIHSCPDFVILETYKRYEKQGLEDGLELSEADYFDNCTNFSSCGECWKRYIDTFADLMDQSLYIKVKNIEFDPETLDQVLDFEVKKDQEKDTDKE